MIRPLKRKSPNIAETAFVSEAAYIIGDVEIGEDTSVWPGAVIRGDFGTIKIGACTAVEDNCVIHSGTLSGDLVLGNVEIGDGVVVGHGAVLNCHHIGSNVLIGMNATLLHDTIVGDQCIVAAGSLLRQGMKVPARSLVAGVPGKIAGKLNKDQLKRIQESYKEYVKLSKQYKAQGL